ncbi:MAG: choice-of-anchor tandem repeat GloVer-containing protein [Bacteroidota bacterium]
MKKVIISSLLFLLFTNAYSQQLWGTMQLGGPSGTGIIYHMNYDGTGFAAAAGFAGNSPQGNLLSYNGYLYGVSVAGGTHIRGDIFKYQSASGVYTSFFSMDSASGYYPRGSLFLASNGKMYGVNGNGGASNFGTLFSFDPVNNIYTKLVDFVNTNGKYPQGNVIEYSGKLYGMTTSGGTSSGGVIFSYELSTGIFLVEHDFSFTDGFTPWGSFIIWNSMLYGMTFGGGTMGYGNIIQFDPATSAVTTVHNFDGTNGGAPISSLCIAGNSLMYGMTQQGGVSNKGVIFSFNTSGNIFIKLHDFNTTDGASPNGSLMQASNGKLYGTTYSGGLNSVGTVFNYDIGSSQFTKVHDCSLAAGGFPGADLLEFNGATSIKENLLQQSILIYSNPVESILKFLLPEKSDNISIKIISSDGNVVYNQSCQTNDNREAKISIGNITSGNYFLNVISGNTIYTAKFIKQ